MLSDRRVCRRWIRYLVHLRFSCNCLPYFALPLEIIFAAVSEPSGCFLASTKTLCPCVSLSAVGVRAVTVTSGGTLMVSTPPPYSMDSVDAPDLVLTVPLAVALGVGFDRYLDHQADLVFWGVVVGYGAVCGLATVVGARRSATKSISVKSVS